MLLVSAHSSRHHVSTKHHSLSKWRSHMLAFPDWHWSARFPPLLWRWRVYFAQTGLVRVVEGNRQLEIGANVECEELGCVVGGPFKPNKHREVRGLVWRPWINKPSEMTMRWADISHHTALSSKHKPPRTCLPCPVSHMVSHLPPLPLPFYLLHIFLFTPSFSPLSYSVLLFLLPLPSISIPPLFMSPQRL